MIGTFEGVLRFFRGKDPRQNFAGFGIFLTASGSDGFSWVCFSDASDSVIQVQDVVTRQRGRRPSRKIAFNVAAASLKRASLSSPSSLRT